MPTKIKQITPEETQKRVDSGEDPIAVTLDMYRQALVILRKGETVDRERLLRDPVCVDQDAPCAGDECPFDGKLCDTMYMVYTHNASWKDEIVECVRMLKELVDDATVQDHL